MADKVEPRPLPDPISDECLEKWKVQYEYRDGIMIGPILLSDFGALIARVERAEKDRDQARRARCEQIGYDERGTHWSQGPRTVLEIAAEEYGQAEASRLFPPEVPR